MKYHLDNKNLVVCGDAFSVEVQQTVDAQFGQAPSAIPQFPLIICDPPYGNISGESWDVADYDKWFRHCTEVAAPDATICMWGGIGKPRHRPFLLFAALLESKEWCGRGETATPSFGVSDWVIKNWITWKKKRAYGVSDNYLFTREECLIITRGKPTFNIPLLQEARGYPGYNKKYPAKSEFLRRTNVWTDIHELFKGKVHPTQKPLELYDVLVKTHSNPGDVVYDPCCGSAVTAKAAAQNGRGYCVVEIDAGYLHAAGYAGYPR